MTKVHAYLNFNGNCDEAFRHYQQVFKCERMSLVRFGDVPVSDSYTISAADKDKIMHTSILISHDTILMGSDVIKGFGHKPAAGNRMYVLLDCETRKEATRLFTALSKDAKSLEMELKETFFAEQYGSFVDKFGVGWMIVYTGNKDAI